MSLFDEARAFADESQMAVFGQAATYNGQPVTVIVEEGLELYDHGHGQVVGHATGLTFQRSEVDKPVKGAVVVVGGKTYRVVGELERDEGMVTVEASHG